MPLYIKKYFPYIIICGLIILIYSNTFFHGFSLDDEFVIKNNELVQSGISAIPKIFISPYFQSDDWSFGYRPFTKAFFAIEYEIFGENPFIHHLINVLLFMVCAGLLFFTFSRIFEKTTSLYFWLTVTLIFVSHPINTEVVCSLKNREEIFYLLFSIISLLCIYLYYKKNDIKQLIIGSLFFTLALLSKQTAIIFIIIIPLTLLVFHISEGNKLFAFFKNYKLIIISIILVIISYIVLSIPEWVLPPEKLDLLSFENPLHNNLETINKYALSLYSLVIYVKLLVFPHPLVFYYGQYTIPNVDFSNIGVLISLIIIILAIFLIIKYHKHKPLLSFGILAILISLIPFSNLIIPINGIIAERFLFFPTFCFGIIISFILFRLVRLSIDIKKVVYKKTSKVFIILAIILLPLSLKSYNRSKAWKDSLTLFSTDIKYLDMSVKANDIYATELFDQVYKSITSNNPIDNIDKKVEDILIHYKKSIELFPKNPKALHNIGTAYVAFKRDGKRALPFLFRANAYDKNNYKIVFNIAQAYHLQNMTDSASIYYKKCIDLKNDFLQAWENYFAIMSQKTDPDNLVDIAEKFNEIFPANDFAIRYLGSIYIAKGDTVKGIECFEKSYSISPQPKGRTEVLIKYFLSIGDSAKAAYYLKKMN